MGFTVDLNFFKGPLDLLLEQVRKRIIEIEKVNIFQITEDYLKSLDDRNLDLTEASEFILLASILLRIKVRWLLPSAAGEEEPVREESKPASFAALERARDFLMEVFERNLGYILIERKNGKGKESGVEADILALSNSFFSLLKRRKTMEAFMETVNPVDYEKILHSTTAKIEEKGFMTIDELVEEASSIEEALVMFFCLLELVKGRRIIVVQEVPFAPIQIWSREAFENADAEA